jgi:MFS family permease
LLEERPFGEEVVMTTQQSPHTPPSRRRRVLSLPHTPLGRWAIGLSVGSGLLIFGLFLTLFLGGDVSPWTWMILIAGILAGAVVGLIALLGSPQQETERSSAVEEAQSRREEKKQGLLNKLMVGLAVLLALPLVGLPIAFLVQWLRWMLRHQLPMVPFALFLVAMMALIAALHFLQRHSERYGSGGTISSAASFVGFALILVGALIGYVSQEWLLGTNLMGVGLVVSTIGLVPLVIFTLNAGVVPWWGGAALVAENPFLLLILLLSIPEGIWEFWRFWLVPVPMLVVGYAVFLAARRRTERPARVR